MEKIDKIVVHMEHYPRPVDAPDDMPEWYCTLPQFKGMMADGMSKQEAFDGVMGNLKVKIMYDNQKELIEDTEKEAYYKDIEEKNRVSAEHWYKKKTDKWRNKI